MQNVLVELGRLGDVIQHLQKKQSLMADLIADIVETLFVYILVSLTHVTPDLCAVISAVTCLTVVL